MCNFSACRLQASALGNCYNKGDELNYYCRKRRIDAIFLTEVFNPLKEKFIILLFCSLHAEGFQNVIQWVPFI